jgi:hypothetical protein
MIELSLPRTSHASLLSRRGFLRASFQAGAVGALAAPLVAAAADANSTEKQAVIQIWLGGGPSHIDLYDLKPNAPAENRGPFKPIATNVPGIDVCELLPQHASFMKHLAVIRSLHHGSHDHVAGTHWMQTGSFGPTAANPTPTHPAIGSCIAQQCGANQPGAVPYMHVRPDLAIDLYLRQFNAERLGAAFDPLHVIMPFPGYSNQVRFDLPALASLPSLNAERLGQRMSLKEQFDHLRRGDVEQRDPRNAFYRQALDLVNSQQVRDAFDLSRETPETREQYGNTGWGQAALLCRRLVEAGVTFVTLNTDSSSNMWDNHAQVEYYFKIMLPAYDRMLSGLIADLVERGLYDRVILLIWGEFGRTPGINTRGGRDHWGHAGCALMGGAGIRGGTIFGSTTSNGAEPLSHPRRPADVLATVCELMGISSASQITTGTGQTLPILGEGQPIRELLI